MVYDRDPQGHVLTKTHREYLARGDTATDYADRRRRERLVKRLRYMLADAWLLAEPACLGDDTVETLFDPNRGYPFTARDRAHRVPDETNPGGRDGEFPHSRYQLEYDQVERPRRERLAALSEGDPADAPEEAESFFFKAGRDLIAFLYRGIANLPTVDFEDVLEAGISKGAAITGDYVEVNIDISSGEAPANGSHEGNQIQEWRWAQFAMESEPYADQDRQDYTSRTDADVPDPPTWMITRRTSDARSTEKDI